jgi:hypothetical protein
VVEVGTFDVVVTFVVEAGAADTLRVVEVATGAEVVTPLRRQMFNL